MNPEQNNGNNTNSQEPKPGIPISNGVSPEENKTGLPPESERKPFKTLRTYQGDVDEILSVGKASATTILVAEQKRREEPPKTPQFQTDNRSRNKFFISAGGALLLLGVIVVPIVYYVKSQKQVAVV